MMRFKPADEPATFDARCRKRGRLWLKQHPKYDRPYDYWTEFEPELREVFKGLCGYCVMRIFKGDVDHFVPVAILKKARRDRLAYEWSNFRYGESTLNGRKWAHRVLDPFEVQDNWFNLLLPSLQLELTSQVPKKHRQLAEFTLTQLGLDKDEVVIRYREEWFKMYRDGNLTLDGLREVAPLIARAVERDLRQNIDWLK